MGDLYLRDLKETFRREQIRLWETEAQKSNDPKRKEHAIKLLKAYEDGEDIEIGEYYSDGTMDCDIA